MKLNSLILAAAALTALATHQAKACSDSEAFLGVALIATVTSAPTGTTLLSGGACRDELLNLQDAAIEYRMTGEMSPVLRSTVDAVQKEQNLATETIIDRLVSAKLGAE